MPESMEVASGNGMLGLEFLQSGATMVRELAPIIEKCVELSGFVPDPDSWNHPEKARVAVADQLDYAERTLVRNTLDYVDKARDYFLMSLEQAELADKPVKMMIYNPRSRRSEVREVTLHEAAVLNHADIRKSVLRHDNGYFRMVRYFFEMRITGGQIPPFPVRDQEDPSQSLEPLHDSRVS